MRMEKTAAVRLLTLLGLVVLTIHITAPAQACQGDSAHGSRSEPVRGQSCPDLMKPTMVSQSKPVRPKPGGTPSVHDVAVVQASAPETATIGSVVMVNSTVVNYGSATENPVVQLWVKGTLVGDDSSITVASHTAATSKIDWNTTNYSPGVYGLVVKVVPVPGEQVTSNNVLQGIFVILTRQPPKVPSSSAPQATGFSPQIVLVVAIAEALAFSFFALGRRRLTGWASLGRRSAHFITSTVSPF